MIWRNITWQIWSFWRAKRGTITAVVWCDSTAGCCAHLVVMYKTVRTHEDLKRDSVNSQLDATITIYYWFQWAQHVSGEIITRNMLSWFKLLINRYCCIQLAVYIAVSMIRGHTNIKLKTWVTKRCFKLNSEITYISKVLQSIIHHCVCKPTFSHVISKVHWWKLCGPLTAPCVMNGSVAMLKK